ncbi:MAG: PfkB family carbohydrate kinase, partial [Anaerolineae bacterium]|nr:PfkB family carbohydrate kinase [Anaerolineae bacterium]
TAVGADEVGRLVVHYLQNEGVETTYIPRKAEARTGMAVVGIEPPDKFPLVFYRENPADIHLTIDDALTVPIADCRAVLLSGTALSRGSGRDVTLFVAEQARAAGVTTVIDLDLRPDQWDHPRAYGLNLRTILPQIEIIIGTEEEFFAALAPDPQQVMRGQPVTAAQRSELEELLQTLLQDTAKVLVVKRGPGGVSIYRPGESTLNVPGFSVTVVNTVGAGDAFASGLLYGHLQGWDWANAARFANACGALVVTRPGCAAAMPTEPEVTEFLALH